MHNQNLLCVINILCVSITTVLAFVEHIEDILRRCRMASGTGFRHYYFVKNNSIYVLTNSLKHKKYGSGEIRTRDLCVPNAESYQARPRSQQTKTTAQFKTIDAIPRCQKITIIKSEIHNLTIFVFCYLLFSYVRERF